MNYSGSLIGMVETLARVPSLKLAQGLDAALETPGTFEHMQQHVKAAPYPGWFAQWPEKEAEATVLRSFELVVVPGLLQTEDYARVVLRCPVGRGKIMHDQLMHLAGMARQPNVVVQVIPLSVGAHEGFRGAFTIADFANAPGIAYQDTAVRGQVVEDGDDLMSLVLLWETLKAEALPRSASLELIEEVAQTWT